jgi:hypothetical protein
MEKKVWVGIDPGATGAVAIIEEGGRVEIRDCPAEETEMVAMMDILDVAFCPEMVFAPERSAL